MAHNNVTTAGPPAQQLAVPTANPANIPTPQGDRDGDVDMNQEDVDSNSNEDEPRELRLQETLKVALPDKYSSNRKELDIFLLQLGMYFRFNADKFTTRDAKSLWAASYLKGEVSKWIELFLSDYFENSPNPSMMMSTTIVIFGSFEGFRREI
jgi:hypothetical protein